MTIGADKISVDLCRTVRFCINPHRLSPARPRSPEVHNSFAGWPSMHGLGAHYELEICCRGVPDPMTGYLLNISRIDGEVRTRIIPQIVQAATAQPHLHPGYVLANALELLQPVLNDSVAYIRWRLSPYYSVMIQSAATDQVILSQHFEFSAAHRLHVPQLSPERNREIFGKCNNPHSHGHNYRLEVRVAVPLPQNDGVPAFSLADLERIVQGIIIARFDHKHLNQETSEFAQINPTVENIARVCFEVLRQPIDQAGGTLHQVKVWETEKTSCTYPALAGA